MFLTKQTVLTLMGCTLFAKGFFCQFPCKNIWIDIWVVLLANKSETHFEWVVPISPSHNGPAHEEIDVYPAI